MDLDLVFLGTGGSMPTAQRAPSATLLRRGGERLLVDCGEGTQRQLLRSTVGLAELTEVFLTHYHADHYLGLPGMLKTFALRGRELPLTVYGPRGLHGLFGALRRIFGRLTYEVELVELHGGDSLRRDGYRLDVVPVEHGVSAIGYALVEDDRPGRFDLEAARALGVPPGPLYGVLQGGAPVTLPDGRVVEPAQVLGATRRGRRVVLSGDSSPCATVRAAAAGADVLVHEATFCEDEAERARDTLHSTGREAAEIARDAGVGLLVVTHISSRYPASVVLREVRETFPEAVAPRDFDVVAVPFPERGPPRLEKGAAAYRQPEPVPSEEVSR